MRHLVIALSFCLFTHVSIAQELDVSAENIPAYFDEIKQLTKQHYSLWDKDLYGSLLLVNPETREVYANEPDSIGVLIKDGNIFKGILPDEISIANTAIKWNGTVWATIMLPLLNDKSQRMNLLAHELFHRAQPSLGFTIAEKNNVHLDTKEGRIYFRLEVEALRKSILSQTEKERKEHLTNAFIFRKYRNQLFPNSDVAENALELNEGIAEYTGQTISGLNKKENANGHFAREVERFLNMPTFVRSFAYQTIPMYGYLLSYFKKDWNKDISDKTNLTDYFIETSKAEIPKNLENAVKKSINKYNGKTITAEETGREERNRKLLAEYRTRFITQPHFDITPEQMRFSFDPRNIVPLDDKGTVYPYIRITDVWGILEVEKGALIASDWRKVTLTRPTEITDKKIVRDGWTLELNAGYNLVKDGENYRLNKQ